MNINIYKKRLRDANLRKRELTTRLEKCKKSHKITRKKLQRQIYNLERGKKNLRKHIAKLREKRK